MAATRHQTSTVREPQPFAPAPFNDLLDTDAVLRSSDSVDFLVKTCFLSFVSPRFAAMFDGIVKDGRPDLSVFPIEADSSILYPVLLLTYPQACTSRLELEDKLECYLSMIRLCREYSMRLVEDKVLQLLAKSTVIIDEPLRVLGKAVDKGWSNNIVQIAAKNTLYKPTSALHYVRELDSLTPADVFQLYTYHFECADAVRKKLREGPSFPAQPAVDAYLDMLIDAAQESIPLRGGLAIDMDFLQTARECIAAMIEEAVSEVSLEIPVTSQLFGS
ncbi:hypothetical protein AMATHDRAFT_48068 [Amanita thiersii Skay4041]|uniref:BTB domain-containing protein n=1 Tax=Amanita thiersii Skay4041 TaxID=703135 RepID=A0A2A9NR75_9AGAR|nr:hypothetical protein AMATHDRAFT_48068 [Amanita thiersii Skay4041]